MKPAPLKTLSRHPLTAFIVGSMVVLFLCATATCAWFLGVFLEKERARAEISTRQLEQAFEIQHYSMAEAMWTGNHEAIAFHVDLVSKQLGDSRNELYISDLTGRCLYHRDKEGRVSHPCDIPGDLEVTESGDREPHQAKSVHFDPARGAYVYAAHLNVGSVCKGHLFAILSDPYDFYRGSLGAVLSRTLPPALGLVLLVWFLWLGISRRFLLKPYLKREVALERKVALAQMASQVAHDIRSPLSALSIAVTYAESLPEEVRTMIRSAVGRIQDIAHGLLEKRRELESNAKPVAETESVRLVSGLLEALLMEKRTQYAERAGVEIVSELHPSSYGLFARVKPTQFKRVISNLIDNAVEAIEERGEVRVDLFREGSDVVVTVRDDGKGIPEEILPLLGKEGMSHGKPRGSGLGLYHATQAVSQWRGRLDLASSPGKGTVVTLRLPRAAAPDWFLTELRLKAGTTVVVLDDDPSIHGVWKERLGPLDKPEHPLHLISFATEAAFREWYELAKPRSGVLYLFDYELLGQDTNGLALIARLGLQKDAVLVTSRFEEPAVLAQCRKLGVRILPKTLAGLLPCLVERRGARSEEAASYAAYSRR